MTAFHVVIVGGGFGGLAVAKARFERDNLVLALEAANWKIKGPDGAAELSVLTICTSCCSQQVGDMAPTAHSQLLRNPRQTHILRICSSWASCPKNMLSLRSLSVLVVPEP